MTRLDWSQLPASLHNAIEHELGATVADTTNASGGFSPGFVARVRAVDGARVFVKAMSRAANPEWVFLYAREARLAPHLPDGAPFPRWRFTVDDGDWIALAFDVIDGREPATPWTTDAIVRVVGAHACAVERLDPSPAPVERAGDQWGDAFTRWRDIRRDNQLRDRLPVGWAKHLDELVELERQWPERTRGECLVHLDLRADNVLLGEREDTVHFVDWAFAARGQPWMDLVCLLPNVAMRGGPDPETIWQQHAWCADTDPEGFDTFLAGWSGMLTHLALCDVSVPVRELQRLHAEQASHARRWLARRRRWDDCET
jgi:aminoglycoside phosphotransferase (APT) family kinase protein